ncbi:MAG TPA: cobalt ECF transporter T component CbiQ [Terriglobia bacterium]|nr:cobalt ECF transporter T component CbiQ [Terriglobia bacterium]
MLQTLDPRSKLIMVLALLLTLSFLRSPVLLGGICLGVWFTALFSKAKMQFVLGRGWSLVLFYTVVLATPAIFNWITPGHSLWVLLQADHEIHWGPLNLPSTLAITDNGLRAALLLVARVGASLSVVMLLLATTSWQKLLRALRCLAVPQVLVLALSMTVRYIHLLLGLALDWFLARKSRTLRATQWREDHRWLGAQVGYLFKRSQELAEDVYSSMVSRGFCGEPKVLETFRWRPVDFISIGIVGTVCLALYLLEARISS